MLTNLHLQYERLPPLRMSFTSYILLNRTHTSIKFWIISGYKIVAVGDIFDISNLDRLGKSEVNSFPLISVLTLASDFN